MLHKKFFIFLIQCWELETMANIVTSSSFEVFIQSSLVMQCNFASALKKKKNNKKKNTYYHMAIVN